MATQHPDNAAAPYWETDGDGFISAQEEVTEAYSSFANLGVDEYMWDWEGKYVDEAVIERLFSDYYNYFKKNKIGKDIFLTFRIPNIWEEKGYSLARAFMAILTAADMAKDLKMHAPPIFEVILPMTTSAKQLIHIQKTFTELAKTKHRLFEDKNKDFTKIEIIPLLESVDGMFDIKKILDQYQRLYKKYYRRNLPYIRPFLARSDPALIEGIIPAVVGNKIAISQAYQWGKENKVPVYPIVGTGSLPFRGSCSPEHIKEFIGEYKGVRTVTIQSGFRYDFPLSKVKRAIKKLQAELPTQTPRYYTKLDIKTLHNITKRAARHYRSAVTGIANNIFKVTPYIPKRRERRLHIGLLGYSRSIGKKEFPRAITFTSALYSLGVPPEFIGTGRTLRSLSKGDGELLHDVYQYLQHDIDRAGRYLNKENLNILAKRHKGWKDIKQDIEFIEDYFGLDLGPTTTNEFLHRNATSDIFYLSKQRKDVSSIVLEAGKLRRSLG